MSAGNAGHHGKETKDDRSCSAQARPAYERDLAGARLKGRQQHSHGDGAAHKEHKRNERQARQQHLRQACGRYEQAEQEEDRHLGHLGEGVKKVRHLDLAGDVARAQHNAGQVHGQKSVAAQVARQRVGDDGHGEQKDGLRTLGRCVCAFNQAARRPADGEAQAHAQDNLLGQQCGNVDVAAGRECGEHGGEHVGDGVVGARFDLEQRVGAAPQRKIVLAQHAKDARRVGRRHDRSQQ